MNTDITDFPVLDLSAQTYRDISENLAGLIEKNGGVRFLKDGKEWGVLTQADLDEVGRDDLLEDIAISMDPEFPEVAGPITDGIPIEEYFAEKYGKRYWEHPALAEFKNLRIPTDA